MSKDLGIFKEGEPLDPNLYTWDIKNRIFYSKEAGLILFNVNPITSYNCTFYTGSNCQFTASSSCTFITGNNCTFNVGSRCKFTTGSNCNFNTGWVCTFKVGKDSVVNVYKNGNTVSIKPIPNQKLIIGYGYDIYYDNPIVDIKYRKDKKCY